MRNVEIFKTDLTDRNSVGQVLLYLKRIAPECSFNFDLEDCDRILRVEGSSVDIVSIQSAMHKLGYGCEYIP